MLVSSQCYEMPRPRMKKFYVFLMIACADTLLSQFSVSSSVRLHQTSLVAWESLRCCYGMSLYLSIHLLAIIRNRIFIMKLLFAVRSLSAHPVVILHSAKKCVLDANAINICMSNLKSLY
jgi:hypothetical protein